MSKAESPSRNGVVYVATGKKFIEEVAHSIHSLNSISPDLPVCLISDDVSAQLLIRGSFDHFILLEHPKGGYRDKVDGLARTPFDKTLFLDTDTCVTRNIDELFVILDRFDIAVCHDPLRRTPTDLSSFYDKPCNTDMFPELNSGVILYKRSDAILAMIDEWSLALEQNAVNHPFYLHQNIPDQPFLHKLIWKNSSIRVYILPPEFNFRTCYVNIASSWVYIAHGKSKYRRWICDSLNRRLGPRVWIKGVGTFFGSRVFCKCMTLCDMIRNVCMPRAMCIRKSKDISRL